MGDRNIISYALFHLAKITRHIIDTIVNQKFQIKRRTIIMTGIALIYVAVGVALIGRFYIEKLEKEIAEEEKESK